MAYFCVLRGQTHLFPLPFEGNAFGSATRLLFLYHVYNSMQDRISKLAVYVKLFIVNSVSRSRCQLYDVFVNWFSWASSLNYNFILVSLLRINIWDSVPNTVLCICQNRMWSIPKSRSISVKRNGWCKNFYNPVFWFNDVSLALSHHCLLIFMADI